MKDSKDLEKEIERLKQYAKALEEENRVLRTRLNRAKDPTPVEKCSFSRLRRIAAMAFITVTRQGRKVIASLGSLSRTFKTIWEAWLFFSQDEWYQSDLFPPPEKKPKKQPHCKFCDAPIQWILSFNRRWLPMNPDGTRHRCLYPSLETNQLIPFTE